MTLSPAFAQQRQTLGVGTVITNDFPDNDRWRTGSYALSFIRGPEWQGQLTPHLGDVVEYRFRGEAISPDNLQNPSPSDRLYAGILSFGAHLHFDFHGYDVTAGADLIAVGEQTRIDEFQSALHDVVGLQQINIDNFQIHNAFYLHGTLEVARDLQFSRGSVRPFVELQVGAEDMIRAGVDVTIGGFGDGGLRVRDVVSGQRVNAINGLEGKDFSFLLGGDVAYVDSSKYLPEERGYQVEDTRYRLRFGINYRLRNDANIFYGATYLSEEFVGQPEGQFVGSLSIGWIF
ncbi:lipid A-modifier LpxR family protein [Rhodophyticola sp. CCM32]|uniref:lipid A-modifier LpxR family protein n=1 Tax=Rhodophyticola sp. CCM32 TaxID=2916397 RepID=UPI00143D318D|nr:lipid A-modifier LpxR family protein [Rhodophyticola sp. CCM32]